MQFFPQPATHIFETPGNGSVIYCTISDGKTSNLGVCPQSQQWEQLEGLHVTKSHHCSTSFSPKTLWTTSDLTPESDFPKRNLRCRSGLSLCEGSGGTQEEDGTRKSHSAAAAAAKSSAGCCWSASRVLSFCCANNAVSHLREPGWKSLLHLVFSGGPAHGLAPSATRYVTLMHLNGRAVSEWPKHTEWLTLVLEEQLLSILLKNSQENSNSGSSFLHHCSACSSSSC